MNILKAITLTIFLFTPLAAVSSAENSKPNIIVFYTDDHGYADLSIQGSVKDVKTPHIDALARSGVLAKQGYSSAPQCVPSRAGLMIGKFQGRFNVDHNGEKLDGFDKETTFAARLQKVGYVTAQFGKWHLGATSEIPSHGFTHSFSQSVQHSFSSNITLDGKDRPMGILQPTQYHIDACSQAAVAIIERYKEKPFFLYIAYRAPHTPLDAPKKYTDRFPGEMPERRRQALGMISAVDDGVGLVTDALKKHGLSERTLIFLIGDNGAPLKIHMTDSPIDGDAGGWDGSLNIPLNGEKGMLAEGGMHTPFLVAWPGTIPGGQMYEHPVSALDVAATAAAIAGVKTRPGDLDGVNLVPYLKGDIKTPPHETLCWRWMAQSAIREGNWKLLRGGEREYLYDLGNDIEEKKNIVSTNPDVAARLRTKLTAWCAELNPPGLALGTMSQTWNDYFDYYLEGKAVTSPPGKKSAETETPSGTQGWETHNGTLTAKDGIMTYVPQKGAGFLVRAKLDIKGPATAKITLKATTGGEAAIAWRSEGQKDFAAENRTSFTVTKSDDWQTHDVAIPATGTIIHVRLHLPGGTTLIRELKITPTAK